MQKYLYSLGVKALISLVLAIALYVATPTPDDLVIVPFIAFVFNLPLILIILIYYGIAWTLVYMLGKLVK